MTCEYMLTQILGTAFEPGRRHLVTETQLNFNGRQIQE